MNAYSVKISNNVFLAAAGSLLGDARLILIVFTN